MRRWLPPAGPAKTPVIGSIVAVMSSLR